jgi:hypothetical protein
MSNTKRTPINRPARRNFSAECLDLFDQMQRLECTCKPPRIVKNSSGFGNVWKQERCSDCTKWRGLHRQFMDTLQPRPKPWQYPCIIPPDGRGDDDAEALTAELENALSERQLQRAVKWKQMPTETKK